MFTIYFSSLPRIWENNMYGMTKTYTKCVIEVKYY